MLAGAVKPLEVSNAPGPGARRVTLKSYTLVNLGADYRINERWQVYGRVENLFDEQYEEVFSFLSPGRAVYAGLRATLQ